MDAEQNLERKALQNTRALIDKLEATEATHAKSQKRALWLIGIAGVLVTSIMAGVLLGTPTPTVDEKKLSECKFDAWSAQASEMTEKIRAANPDMPYGEIAKKLKAEQESFLASARTTCGEKAQAAK